ncbi:hypothetical protein OESDEN_24570 [Oesophagostomum dentatum]|uniref:Uncharacterized protein n=1 Tax=Oesophagostomum dentatum TaxID=61180 RepID=A0A0B1RRX6_OESDE|nr:hypothetical protein OESDEN_24570 [Oesophagostomum dentatum]
MPGKLDHASVVAYTVGRRDSKRDVNSPVLNGINGHHEMNCPADEDNGEEAVETRTVNVNMENFTRMDKATCCATLTMRDGDTAKASINIRIRSPSESPAVRYRRSRPPTDYPLRDMVEPRSPDRPERPISPYEQLPVSFIENLRRSFLNVFLTWTKRTDLIAHFAWFNM